MGYDEKKYGGMEFARGHLFLRGTHSQPLTIKDLKPGEKFVLFPRDGDDSGHGGFRGGGTLLERIKFKRPAPPGHGLKWHESVWITCVEVKSREEKEWPENYPVFRVWF